MMLFKFKHAQKIITENNKMNPNGKNKVINQQTKKKDKGYGARSIEILKKRKRQTED